MLKEILKDRIAIIDGAMGTMIQSYDLGETDYRSNRFKNHKKDLIGNNDILCLTKPELISEIANQYGSQCVVVAIDTMFINGEWMVYVHGGRTITSLKTIEWAQKVTEFGAGELLLTSMNNDGTKAGFAMDITNEVSKSVNIPVIASGGAGSQAHFLDLFTNTEASAGLAASIFHYSEIPIPELKNYLQNNNILVRNTKN